jgi:hypothetical integral membrane protein (TIGR02206 family)
MSLTEKTGTLTEVVSDRDGIHRTMVVQHQIALLSIPWMLGIASSIVMILFIYGLVAATHARYRERISIFLGIVILAEVASTHVYLATVLKTWSLMHSLPLHICRLSLIVSGITLLTKSQLSYEWSAYLGVPSGLNAILTPQLTQGITPWMLLDFYFSHSMMIVVPILMTIFYSSVPRPRAVLYMFAAANLMAMVVFPVNYVFDANYMFLMRKPIADSPFFVGPWPYYILGLEVMALLHLLLMDLFFRVGFRNLAAALRSVTTSRRRVKGPARDI